MVNPARKVWQGIQYDAKAIRMLFSSSLSYGSGLSYWFSGRTRYDYAAAVGDGTNNSAVAACLGWIGRTFPEAPVEVRQRKGTEWETIPDHDLAKLIDRPNNYYSGAVLWAATLTSFHTDGNAYWVKAKNNQTGFPINLWWIPHTLIEPISDADDVFIQYYRYHVAGQEFRLNPRDVVHFRNGIDPNNPKKGLAPLKAALREVFADDEASLFTGALMRNAGVPGIIVSPSSDSGLISKSESETIKADLEQKIGGDNRGRALILGQGVNVNRLAWSPEEMNLRELRRLPEERISAVLGIPAIVAGLGAGLDRSTFSNMEEARAMAWYDNIKPTQRTIAADLSVQLLPDFDTNPNLRVFFDNSDIGVMQEDANALSARVIQQLQAGAITVAEARRDLGKDAGPEHNYYLIPSGYDVRATLEAPEPEPEIIEAPMPELEPPTDDDITALLAGRG